MLLYEPLEGSGGPARLRASWRSTACASRMSTICAAAGTAQIAVCQAKTRQIDTNHVTELRRPGSLPLCDHESSTPPLRPRISGSSCRCRLRGVRVTRRPKTGGESTAPISSGEHKGGQEVDHGVEEPAGSDAIGAVAQPPQDPAGDELQRQDRPQLRADQK